MNKGRLIESRTEVVLVIIDMQERLVPAVMENDHLVANAKRLIKFSNLTQVPIIVTEQEKLGSTLPELRELIPSFAPINKLSFNCFKAPNFERRVQELGKRTLVLLGVEAHICVLQTALHGLNHYSVHVIADAVSSRTLQNKDIALRRMESAGVVITSTETFMYEVMQEAGTPLFKKVLPLVK